MISIIIPIYDPDHKLSPMIADCVHSFIKNSRDYEIILVESTDGFEINVNRGIKMAKGDYLCIAGDDVMMYDPDWIEKSCIPNTITAPKLTFNLYQKGDIPDVLWVIPRTVIEKVGLFDEQFAYGYGFGDNDYWVRAKLNNVPIVASGVNATNADSATYNAYNMDRSEILEKNRRLFVQKWPHLA